MVDVEHELHSRAAVARVAGVRRDSWWLRHRVRATPRQGEGTRGGETGSLRRTASPSAPRGMFLGGSCLCRSEGVLVPKAAAGSEGGREEGLKHPSLPPPPPLSSLFASPNATAPAVHLCDRARLWPHGACHAAALRVGPRLPLGDGPPALREGGGSALPGVPPAFSEESESCRAPPHRRMRRCCSKEPGRTAALAAAAAIVQLRNPGLSPRRYVIAQAQAGLSRSDLPILDDSHSRVDCLLQNHRFSGLIIDTVIPSRHTGLVQVPGLAKKKSIRRCFYSSVTGLAFL